MSVETHIVSRQNACLYKRTIETIQVLGILGMSSCALFVPADVKRGDQHLAEQHWEEAALAYKQALKDDPFNLSLQGKYVLARERAAGQRISSAPLVVGQNVYVQGEDGTVAAFTLRVEDEEA